MRFKNTIRVFVENFKNVYKILLYKLIVGVIAGALLCALILPEAVEIFSSSEWNKLFHDISQFFFTLVPGHEGSFETAKDTLINGSLPAFGSYIWARAGELIGISIGCIVVYLLSRFAETICYFSVGDILDDRMQTYGEMTFSSSLVKNLGRASRYALIYVPFAFVFDVLIVGIAYLCLSVFKIFFGLFFAMVLIVLMQALKMTIACFWMPAMTADKLPFKQATKVMGKEGKGQFWKTFSVYVILVYVIIALNVLAVICTFASGLIITVPISFALLICFQYVNYYTVLGRRYFITFRAISINDEKGDSEHFFERVMQTEAEQVAEQAAEEEKLSDLKNETVESK